MKPTTDLVFERDLRWALAARAPQAVPASLSRAAAAMPLSLPGPNVQPTSLGKWFGRLAAAAVTSVAAVIVLVLISTSVLGARPINGGAGSGIQHAFSWGTQMATLEANTLTIEVGGKAFHAPRDAEVHSDPGSATYRTLEVSWRDSGAEMRLYLYLAANDSNWWVNAVRTYDGTAPGEWLYYVTPQVRASLGASFEADVDVLGVGPHGIGRLRIDGMRLSAFAPGSIPHSMDGCRAASRANDHAGPVIGRINPDVPGVTLSAGMSAITAEQLLADAGLCYEFRLEYPASNLGQIWCSAPPGDVREWSLGSDGDVLLFVEAPPRQTLPRDAPQVVGC